MNQHSPQKFPTVSFVGVDGVLVRFGETVSARSNQAALAFHRHMETANISGILECAPSLIAVYFRLDLDLSIDVILDRIRLELGSNDWFEAESHQRRLWTIPCSFDGPQLKEAAALAGVSETKAVEQLTSATTQVLTLGFAPGQPYLGNLDPHWDIPRMDGIAPNVPQNALVVAVRQLIIFANATPTGWRHIGQTAFRCFDQERRDPFAFKAGDQVRFDAVARSEIDALSSDTFGGARLEVRR